MATPPTDFQGATRVTNPNLAWHAAHANALQRVAAAIDFHLPRPGDLPAEELRAGLDRIRQLVRETEAGHWRDALALLTGSAEQVRALLHAPRPAIDYDELEGAPMILWADEYDAEPDAWGVVDLAPGFSVTTPFRQVRTERLPAGTQFVPIDEPLHLCRAVACETWAMLDTDLGQAARATPRMLAWRRAELLADFYASVILRTLGAVEPSEFVAGAGFPAQLSDADVPHALLRVANTLRARQFVALAFARDLLTALLHEAQRESETGWDEMVAAVRRVREDAVHSLREANARRIRAAGLAAEGMVTMVILRPLPPGQPLLALIPEASVAQVERVAA